MAEVTNYKDKYAEIGTMDIKATREALITEEPEALPELYLTAEGIDRGAIFTYQDKELNKEQLEAAITKQKAYYMPFFADHAPALQIKRLQKELKYFDWRIGTDKDARDFQAVLRGEGNWEQVTIPHFGPPLGVATTYYRTEFTLAEAEIAQASQWICFKGVDYKASLRLLNVSLPNRLVLA